MIYDVNGNELVVEEASLFLQIFDKITGIGDSLMAGYTATSSLTVSSADAKARGTNWLNYIGLEIGRTPVNLAVGNTRAYDWRYGDRNADIATANISTNAYLIGIGVNDSRYNSTIGSSSDINSSDPSQNANSYYGNMDYIIRTIHGYNPNAHIFVFTIPGNETLKSSINSAIRYICTLYSYTHCIDLDVLYGDIFTDGFINDNLYSGHFNPLTYRYIASLILRALNEYIYREYTKFVNVPYSL